MNTMLDKLSSIEAAAVSIMDDANAKKKEIAHEYEKKTEAFDAQTEADTLQKLSQIRDELDKEMHTRLEQQQSDAKAEIVRLNNVYETHHTAFANDIFQMVIK